MKRVLILGAFQVILGSVLMLITFKCDTIISGVHYLIGFFAVYDGVREIGKTLGKMNKKGNQRIKM